MHIELVKPLFNSCENGKMAHVAKAWSSCYYQAFETFSGKSLPLLKITRSPLTLFDVSDIEDLTRKTGNYKQFQVFVRMLESAIVQVACRLIVR